jgi:hypothetical protein
MVQVIEYLPSKHKTLSSNTNTIKNLYSHVSMFCIFYLSIENMKYCLLIISIVYVKEIGEYYFFSSYTHECLSCHKEPILLWNFKSQPEELRWEKFPVVWGACCTHVNPSLLQSQHAHKCLWALCEKSFADIKCLIKFWKENFERRWSLNDTEILGVTGDWNKKYDHENMIP